MKKSKLLIGSLVVAMLANSFTMTANACGPFIPEAVLVFDTNPDLPLKQYLDGELGVIRPDWAKSYLVVAYRSLINKPLSAQERAGVFSLWRQRIGQSVFSDNTDNADAAKPNNDAKEKLVGADLWQKMRGTVPAVKPVTLDTSRSTGTDTYDTFLNCPDSSFENASKSLQEKIAKHGVGSPFVKEWVAAQDLVFCHCGTPGGAYDAGAAKGKGPAEPPFPAFSKDKNDAEVAADRAYQHAAAEFYAEKFDDAFKEFGTIAGESANPYSKISRYMMPRCLIRKATLTKLDKTSLQSTYAQAEKLLREMMADPAMANLHTACDELMGFLVYRSDPTNRLKELANRLLQDDKSITAEQFYRSLDDYTQLLLTLQGGPQDPYSDTPAKKSPIPAAAKNDDLSDWITIWESDDKAHFAHALEHWHKDKSEAWLLAALHLAPKDKSVTDELIKAAHLIKTDSPASLSFGYEIARLHLLRGEVADATNDAESLKAVALKKKLWSAANLFMDLRSTAPIDVEQFVENAIRIPAAVAVDDEYLDEQFSTDKTTKKKNKNQQVFDFSAAQFMNEKMPLSVLTQVVAGKLPAKLQADAEQAAWVRAVVLNDSSSIQKMLPAMQRDYPKLTTLLQATNVGSTSDKKFAAVYLILKNPGMRPYVRGGAARDEDFGKLDTYGDNWWNSTLPDQSVTYTDKGDVSVSKLKTVEFPQLLTSEQSRLGLENKKQLLATGSAPTFFCSVVADFAATHKDDPRVPEALHLAVRASHYGWKENRTTPLSKKCFTLLHANYPKNTFTRQTPYFY